MTRADVLSWILASSEPAARWIVHAFLLDGAEEDRLAAAEHAAVLADPGTQELIARLPDWESAAHLSGHQSPAFAPNLLGLLADMGVGSGDDDRIERVLDAMLRHQFPDGRFALFATGRVARSGFRCRRSARARRAHRLHGHAGNRGGGASVQCA